MCYIRDREPQKALIRFVANWFFIFERCDSIWTSVFRPLCATAPSHSQFTLQPAPCYFYLTSYMRKVHLVKHC